MTSRELSEGTEKLMVFSDPMRRCIIIKLLEASIKNTPITVEYLESNVSPKKTLMNQLAVLQKVGFIDTMIVDITGGSPHATYFLTDKAISALNEIGVNKSTVKSIIEKYERI